MGENDVRLSKIPVPEQGEDAKFPIGMKVLAIDANIVCLRYLVQLLRKCQYKVTSTTEAAEAIKLLRDSKEAFDIVITDVVRVDMDGFKLLEIIGLEMDIPVVMVSANDEVDVVKRGVKEGAQAYLLKPVRLQELKNIWQHVLRKKLEKKSNIISIEEIKDQRPKTHERVGDKEEDEGDKTTTPVDNSASSSSTRKKPRVTWSKELHLKFVDAFEQLGEKERVPNNILKLMNVPGLTRENIASHLQKHRDGLRKKAAENAKHSNGPLELHVRIGDIISERNCGVRNPAKRSIIYSEINQRDKTPNFTSSSSFFSNLRAQMSTPSQFQYPQLAAQFEREVQELHGSEYPRSTSMGAGSYFPVPEFKWLNFPSHNSNLKPCDGYLGFSSDPVFNNVTPQSPGPNNINPYYLHPFGGNCLNSTSQTVGNSPIEIGAIPQQAPIAWPFPSNCTAGQCSKINEDKSAQYSEPQFDKGSFSHHQISSSMDDDLSEILQQFHNEGAL